MKTLTLVLALLICVSANAQMNRYGGGGAGAASADSTVFATKYFVGATYAPLASPTLVTPTLGVAKATSLTMGGTTVYYPLSVYPGSNFQVFNAAWETNLIRTSAAQAADSCAFTMVFDGAGNPEFKLTNEEGLYSTLYANRLTIASGKTWTSGVVSSNWIIGKTYNDARASNFNISMTTSGKPALSLLGPDSVSVFSVDSTGIVKAGTLSGTVRATAGVLSATASDTVGLAASLALKALSTDLFPNGTNGGQMVYIDTVGVDTMKSRYAYSAPPWSIDSANIKTTFNRFWFRQTADSLAVDTVFCVLRGTATDTVTVRVLWGTSLGTAVDSLSDLKSYSLTTGTKAVSTKVIPPYNMVWVKLVEADGTATEACIMLDGRRKWAQ